MNQSTRPAPSVRGRLSHLEAQRTRWQSLITDLDHPDTELCVETTAPLVATFSALKRAGEPLDRALCVLMAKLRQQMLAIETAGGVE